MPVLRRCDFCHYDVLEDRLHAVDLMGTHKDEADYRVCDVCHESVPTGFFGRQGFLNYPYELATVRVLSRQTNMILARLEATG